MDSICTALIILYITIGSILAVGLGYTFGDCSCSSLNDQQSIGENHEEGQAGNNIPHEQEELDHSDEAQETPQLREVSSQTPASTSQSIQREIDPTRSDHTIFESMYQEIIKELKINAQEGRVLLAEYNDQGRLITVYHMNDGRKVDTRTWDWKQIKDYTTEQERLLKMELND